MCIYVLGLFEHGHKDALREHVHESKTVVSATSFNRTLK